MNGGFEFPDPQARSFPSPESGKNIKYSNFFYSWGVFKQAGSVDWFRGPNK